MGKRVRRYQFVIISSLLLLSAFLMASPCKGVDHRSLEENTIEAVIEPNVWIELESDVMEIDVDTNTKNFNYLRGTVHCEIPIAAPPGYQVKVIMYSNYVGTYDLIFHRNLQQMDFQEVLTVSKATPAHTPILKIFDGQWATENPKANGQIDPVACEIWALPFGEVHFSEVVGDISIKEEKWFEFEVPIENYGNCQAEITLQVETEDNVEIDIIQQTIGIDEKLTDGFVVNMKVKSGAPDSGNIRMTATSNIQGTNMQDVYTIGYEKDMRIIGQFTAPIIIVFLSTFSLIVIVTLVVIFWRIRNSMRKDGSISYQ